MFKRHTITLIALMGIVISTFAMINNGGYMNYDNPTSAKLENNEEYQRLMAESERMRIMSDSVQTLLSDIKLERTLYLDTLTTEPSYEIMHNYSQRIVLLEDEIFSISQKQGEIASRINDIEMSIIEEGFVNIFDTKSKQDEEAITKIEENEDNNESQNDDSQVIEEENTSESIDPENSDVDSALDSGDTIPDTDVTTTTDEQSVETEPIRHRNIIDDERFVNYLSVNDLNDLRLSQQREVATKQLVDEYIKQYEALDATFIEYGNATNQQVADSIYTIYAAQFDTLDSLNTEINQMWNFVVDTKYYTYGYILEKERNKELLSKLDEKFNSTLQQCANNDGLYASNSVMHYAISRPAILDLEVEIASGLGIADAIDSLTNERNTFVTPSYKLTPIKLEERRLFIDYSDITFGRTNYYNANNPVPEVKVYERGTIYRILLGVFKSQQPMTLFKGVRPLYITKDEHGLYHYYTGGFATFDEAKEAQKQLYDKGFKAPEICCWMDGVVANLSSNKEDDNDSQSEDAAAKRYMLRIMEQDMSDAIKQRIAELHPTKMISLTKDGYVVGSFEGHDEVTRLFITLSDEFGINLEILEVEVK